MPTKLMKVFDNTDGHGENMKIFVRWPNNTVYLRIEEGKIITWYTATWERVIPAVAVDLESKSTGG